MHSFHTAIVPRGMMMASSHYEAFGKDGDEDVKVPALFMLVISLTLLVMMGLLFSVSLLYQSIRSC